MPPDSGTLAGIPAFRTAALISAITQMTSCSQASQTTTASTVRIACVSSWWVSSDTRGRECGSGRPMKVIRPSGTPPVSAASAMTAKIPARTSPAVRRGRSGARVSPGIGGAISTPPLR